jgi:multiple sugar transport system ATP-binding protein
MSGLELQGVSKSYGAFHAVKSVDLSVAPGEFVVMVGPSGCGKSTLLRTVAGLEAADQGTIRVGNRDVTHAEPSDRGVAMVFQNYALYPHMTVAGNMGFGLKMAGTPRERIVAAVERAAAILRIRDHLPKQPKALSGGQKQRVAIGRAITRSPEVFLFDEPLSNLDAELRTRMRVELGRLHNELGATMIYVTHDQIEAMTMADRIVVLRDGVIEQVGPPLDLYNRPANEFVAGFLGAPRMNFVPGRVVSASPSVVTVEAPLVGRVELDLDNQRGRPLTSGDWVSLGLRPESFRDGDLPVRLAVQVVESLGRETLVYGHPTDAATSASDGDSDIVIQVPEQLRLRPGQVYDGRIRRDALFLFDSDGLTRRFARLA